MTTTPNIRRSAFPLFFNLEYPGWRVAHLFLLLSSSEKVLLCGWCGQIVYSRDMFSGSNPLSDIDSYEDEYEQFQWDVHILIEGTLRAAIRYLDTEAKDEMGKLEEWMKKPISDEAHEHLVDERVDVMARNYDQERF
jgi:hypothetical protein